MLVIQAPVPVVCPGTPKMGGLRLRCGHNPKRGVLDLAYEHSPKRGLRWVQPEKGGLTLSLRESHAVILRDRVVPSGEPGNGT